MIQDGSPHINSISSQNGMDEYGKSTKPEEQSIVVHNGQEWVEINLDDKKPSKIRALVNKVLEIFRGLKFWGENSSQKESEFTAKPIHLENQIKGIEARKGQNNTISLRGNQIQTPKRDEVTQSENRQLILMTSDYFNREIKDNKEETVKSLLKDALLFTPFLDSKKIPLLVVNSEPVQVSQKVRKDHPEILQQTNKDISKSDPNRILEALSDLFPPQEFEDQEAAQTAINRFAPLLFPATFADIHEEVSEHFSGLPDGLADKYEMLPKALDYAIDVRSDKDNIYVTIICPFEISFREKNSKNIASFQAVDAHKNVGYGAIKREITLSKKELIEYAKTSFEDIEVLKNMSVQDTYSSLKDIEEEVFQQLGFDENHFYTLPKEQAKLFPIGQDYFDGKAMDSLDYPEPVEMEESIKAVRGLITDKILNRRLRIKFHDLADQEHEMNIPEQLFPDFPRTHLIMLNKKPIQAFDENLRKQLPEISAQDNSLGKEQKALSRFLTALMTELKQNSNFTEEEIKTTIEQLTLLLTQATGANMVMRLMSSLPFFTNMREMENYSLMPEVLRTVFDIRCDEQNIYLTALWPIQLKYSQIDETGRLSDYQGLGFGAIKHEIRLSRKELIQSANAANREVLKSVRVQNTYSHFYHREKDALAELGFDENSIYIAEPFGESPPVK